jgi:N-acetyl-anhydromuramyl-L-alanine amidase AmpD
MRAITTLVIHCSATPNGRTLFSGIAGKPNFSTPADEINRWHKARGFHRSPQALKRQEPRLCCIGYHFVVATNGAVFNGRAIEEIGAHVQGHNRDSIGICMVGTDQYSVAQWGALAGLVSGLQKRFAGIRVLGHRDLSPDTNGDGTVEPREWLKTCPGFTVREWLDGDMKPLHGHILDAPNAA